MSVSVWPAKLPGSTKVWRSKSHLPAAEIDRGRARRDRVVVAVVVVVADVLPFHQVERRVGPTGAR